MKKQLKNMAAYNGSLLKMDKDTYALRKKVMDVIYEIKNKGYNLPRIEVRIVTENTEACAYAYLGKNIVHVNKKYINNTLFTQIILHEVIHAVFGVPEVIGCQLMHCSKFWDNKVDIKTAWALFGNYYNNWKR